MTISEATIGLPVNLGGTLQEVDSSTTVDNVFVFESGSKKWQIVFDGGFTLYRTSWLNIGNPPTDKTSLFNIILSNADIKTIEIDTDIQLSGTVNAGGRVLLIVNNGNLSGTFTLQNAEISADPAQPIFTGTPTLTSCKSRTGKWYPTWFGAKGDGATNNFPAIDTCIDTANSNSQKVVSLIPGDYLIENNLTIPSGVTLQFEIGAYVSGNATLSGSGTFDCKPTLTFGTGITVSGIYPITGEITPQAFGAVGNNSIDDSVAFQGMFDYINTLSNGSVSAFFPPKKYYQASTVNLPQNLDGFFLNINGYGATIRTDQDITIWSRMPEDQSEASTIISGVIGVIEGFRFQGNSSWTNRKTNQIALRLGALYSWQLINLHIETVDTAIALYFSLQSKIDNIRITNQTNIGILGRSGDWSGATTSNSAFNSNKITNCRIFNGNGSLTSVYLRAADQTIIENIISEGSNPQYNFYIDDLNSPLVQHNTLSQIWIESVGDGPNAIYPRNTNFYLYSKSKVIIDTFQRDYDNVLFEIIAGNSFRLIMNNLSFNPTINAPIFNVSGGNLYRIAFTNFPSDWQEIVNDPSNWHDGVVGDCTIHYDIPNSKMGFSSSRLIEFSAKNGTLFKSNQANVAPIYINSSKSVSACILYGTQNAGVNVSNVFNAGLAMFIGTRTSSSDVVNINSSTGVDVPKFVCVRSRGTNDSPLGVGNGDLLGGFSSKAYDGSAVIETAIIKMHVDGSVSSGIIPTRVRIFNRNTSGVLSETFGIRASGQIELPVEPTTGNISDLILTRNSSGNLRKVSATDIINSFIISGSYSSNGTGSQTTFTVPHGFGNTPNQVLIAPTNAATAITFYVTNKNSITFDVVFTSAPPAGTNNVTFDWLTK